MSKCISNAHGLSRLLTEWCADKYGAWRTFFHAGTVTTKSNKWKKLAFKQSTKTPLLCMEDGQFERKTFRGSPLAW
ncbi:hypothetical protein [Absidia glauca]|uniref:Uncharacterized protein n=1 Tax=Absidia glauca TaxID=4829 RepID=A0A163IQA6_ABSGL|nr:hypothetical protein [Absidia glauca]